MMKFAILFSLALSSFAHADQIAGDYRKDNQHAVFITKIKDQPNTYYTTIFLVGKDNQSCLFEQEMKLASGGLVYAAVECGVGISKDADGTVKVVGACPAHCANGMSIADQGFVKAADTEPVSREDLYKGD